jgi:hydrogenase maturation factor
MCLGTVALLLEIEDQSGVRTGELDNGVIVPLSFVPDARAGDHLLLHLGIPVEVVEVTDHE